MSDLVVTILLCYSDKDKSMVDKLKTHLKPLENYKRIILWDYDTITPGADRKEEMDKRLDEAQIILLQVSASFLASEDWHCIEQQAIKRHERKEAHVIPVILRSAMWEITLLHNLKPLPNNGKPIAEWPTQFRDRAYKDVAAGIFKVIGELEALSLLDERRILNANLDQLIETIRSQIQSPRAEALIYTLQQSRMIIPDEVTLADLVVGWRALSHASKQEEEIAIERRRLTCGELANLASQFTTNQGSLTQAIKTWRIWRDTFQNSGDPRQAAMASTFARELTELQEMAAIP